jgi:hypothetical protein
MFKRCTDFKSEPPDVWAAFLLHHAQGQERVTVETKAFTLTAEIAGDTAGPTTTLEII